MFLEDNSTVELEKNEVLDDDRDYSKLMMDDEKRKELNLNNVIKGFCEARQTILNEVNIESNIEKLHAK